MFLIYFESQNIVFQIHIMQIGIKFPIQKYYVYTTLRSLIKSSLYFDRSRRQF